MTATAAIIALGDSNWILCLKISLTRGWVVTLWFSSRYSGVDFASLSSWASNQRRNASASSAPYRCPTVSGGFCPLRCSSLMLLITSVIDMIVGNLSPEGSFCKRMLSRMRSVSWICSWVGGSSGLSTVVIRSFRILFTVTKSSLFSSRRIPKILWICLT